MKEKIQIGLLWKLFERFGVQGGQFLLQIILARILEPEHYGTLSMMIIFISLANVFIQTGFNTALIREKDVIDEDYSSVFWISLGIATVLYFVIYIATPYIASFYQMQEIVMPLRVLALMLLPGSFYSVQLAKVSREMNFRKVFFSNIGAVVLSGIIGICIALSGGGLWALVVQNVLSIFIACIIMSVTVKWMPKIVCDLKRIKYLFSFGWKLLVSSLLDTLYQDLRSLIIGKKYDSITLGFYNRGKQFPQFIINAINGAVQSVMLPAMAAEQDEQAKVKILTRKSIMVSAYIIFPIMAGLAGVASPLVELLLTDKWLPCVPYLQIYCISLAFYPVHSCNLQAINAMGRSDIFLKLEIIKKSYGLVALIIAVVFFDTPIAIAMTGVVTVVISCYVNAYPNKKLIEYSYVEQVKDICPSLICSILMYVCVSSVGYLGWAAVYTLMLQIIVGVVSYILLSLVFKLEPFKMLISVVEINRGREE